MNLPEYSNFESLKWKFFSLSRRSAALTLTVATAAILTSCSQPEAEMAMLVDSFNSQLEEKNKELVALRSSETDLRTQLAETSGRMQQMEAQIIELKGKSSINEATLGASIAASLKGTITESVKAAVTQAQAQQPVAQTQNQPSTNVPPNSGRNGGVSTRASDPNVQKFDFNFP